MQSGTEKLIKFFTQKGSNRLSNKKKQKQIDTLFRVIESLQDDMEANSEFNKDILKQVMAKNALFVKFVSETLEIMTQELIGDFEEWAEGHGFDLSIQISDHSEKKPPKKLWTIDDIMKDLKPPETN